MNKKFELKKMKVVILAGGFGTRLSEYTKDIPKPMVKIGKTPILLHIIKYYEKFGYNEFLKTFTSELIGLTIFIVSIFSI